jgi:hypothetical protein
VHTITFDSGKEFAAHQDIAHALKIKIFFATPCHARERGLNENTNDLIRGFFPKRTDFSTISNAEVAKVERLLNARPRKSLDFRSPQEVSLTFKFLCAGKLNPRIIILSSRENYETAPRPPQRKTPPKRGFLTRDFYVTPNNRGFHNTQRPFGHDPGSNSSSRISARL